MTLRELIKHAWDTHKIEFAEEATEAELDSVASDDTVESLNILLHLSREE